MKVRDSLNRTRTLGVSSWGSPGCYKMYDEYNVPDDWLSTMVDGYTLYFRVPEHEAPAREVYGWLKSHRKLIHQVGRSFDSIMWTLLLDGKHRSYMINYKKRYLVFYS